MVSFYRGKTSATALAWAGPAPLDEDVEDAVEG